MDLKKLFEGVNYLNFGARETPGEKSHRDTTFKSRVSLLFQASQLCNHIEAYFIYIYINTTNF